MPQARRLWALAALAAMLLSFLFSRTTASAGGEPDLIVLSMAIELQTGGFCNYQSTQLGVRIVVRNQGSAAADPFAVDVNGAQQTVSAGLLAGANASRWFPGYMSGNNTAFVDATFAVTESNEANNQVTQFLPVPTLPAPCTPTPTPAAVGGIAELAGAQLPAAAEERSSTSSTDGVMVAAAAALLFVGGAAWWASRQNQTS